MKKFSLEIKQQLAACKNDKERLTLVLKDIFAENYIPQEEQIPVFWGKIQKNLWAKTFCISKLKTLAGTPVKNNPYILQELEVQAKGREREDFKENDEVCVIVQPGILDASHNLLNQQQILKMSDIGCSADLPYSKRISYLLSCEKLISYRSAMEKMLKAQKRKSQLQYNLKMLQDEIKKQNKQLDGIQKRIAEVAPNGIEEFEQELSNKQALYIELQKKLSAANYYVDYLSVKPIDNVMITAETANYTDFIQRLDYVYDESIVIPFLMALSTNQIITLYGPPGKGKTTLVTKLAKALGAKCTIVSVQNSWTDSADILGYYSPIDKTYEGTAFIEALIDAYREWLNAGKNSRLHIICLDEMNLARVEYYFATFLSLLQLPEDERLIHLLPAYIEDELNDIADTASQGKNKDEHLDKNALPSNQQYLWRLRKYHEFKLPPNVRFVGTINNDDTTNELSPKVRDRSMFISLDSVKHTEDRKLAIKDYYPVSFFEITSNKDISLPGEFQDENNRFIAYSKTMIEWTMTHLPEYLDESRYVVNKIYDYLVVTKILPILRKKSDFKYYGYKGAVTLFNERAENTPGEYFDLLGGY